MMPLAMANVGEQMQVKKVGGKTEVKQFLEKLGFVTGVPITIVTKTDGNVIVSIKESRVAISREMAYKIMI